MKSSRRACSDLASTRAGSSSDESSLGDEIDSAYGRYEGGNDFLSDIDDSIGSLSARESLSQGSTETLSEEIEYDVAWDGYSADDDDIPTWQRGREDRR